MSAYDLSGLLDIMSVIRTKLVGDTESTIVAYLKGQDAGSKDPIAHSPDDNEIEIDWWQHYGFLSRPPKDAESLVLRLGGQIFGLASRALAASGVFGKMGEGDVAIYSIGGNVIRLNANGSLSVIVPTTDGKQIIFRIDPKGWIKCMVPPSYAFEFGKDGLVCNMADKDVTFACRNFNVVAQALNNNSPTIKLNMAAVKPMTPTTAVNPGVFV